MKTCSLFGDNRSTRMELYMEHGQLSSESEEEMTERKEYVVHVCVKKETPVEYMY